MKLAVYNIRQNYTSFKKAIFQFSLFVSTLVCYVALDVAISYVRKLFELHLKAGTVSLISLTMITFC